MLGAFYKAVDVYKPRRLVLTLLNVFPTEPWLVLIFNAKRRANESNRKKKLSYLKFNRVFSAPHENMNTQRGKKQQQQIGFAPLEPIGCCTTSRECDSPC
jgi:hypothetical protein